MARVNMEELVDIYQEVLNFDSKSNDIRIYIYKNKEDLIKKYVESNLMKLKIKEPKAREKYDDNFKEDLENIRLLCNSFHHNDIIIVGVYGKYVDSIDIHNNDVRLYHLSEIELLKEDVKKYYS